MILLEEQHPLEEINILISPSQIESIRPATFGKRYKTIVTFKSGRVVYSTTSFEHLVHHLVGKRENFVTNIRTN